MQVKLSEILSSLESGGRPKGGASLDNNGIPSLGAEHLDGNGGFNFKSVKYIPEDYFNGLKSGIIEKENILIVKDGATTGKVSFVNDEFPFEKAAVNEHVFLLKIDKSKAYPRFAFHYLKCSQGQKDIMRDFRGATVGGISRGFVDFVKFQLPPLPDQLHIASILSKAENLIAQRKESIRLLDEFLNSTFLEMFGECTRNKRKWDKIELKYFGEIITGSTPPRNNDENYSSNFIEWIKTDNIPVDETYITEAVEYLSETGSRYARTVEAGALLVACIAGSIQSVGRAALTNRKVSFNQQINAIQPNEEIEPLYLYWLFKISRKYIQDSASNGMKKILTKGGFEKIKMIKPPLSLQTQFAQIVEKTEALKSQYQQSLQELENLYGSLSQKAFRGELVKI